ncbi:MAG: hypothetical protein EXR49_08105, partial [Dehalococcoidia bacterium]|nr:hypothetical protein [Dehalococcoidia bacterium]
QSGPKQAIPILAMDPVGQRRQVERLKRVRRERNEGGVRAALAALGTAADTSANLMPLMVDAVKANATLGEITDALRAAWGEHLAFGGARKPARGKG